MYAQILATSSGVAVVRGQFSLLVSLGLDPLLEARGPPPVAQAYEISNLAKDFKISREISRDFQISKDISRFPEGFLDFRRDLEISRFPKDFQMSGGISRFPERFQDFRISGEFPVVRRDRYREFHGDFRDFIAISTPL